jgi:uncharacterized protein (TIGR03435 family)
MILDAYREVPRFDLPEWTRAKFDVSVKMPPRTTADTCRQMLRNLLTERFHMVASVETRDVPTYVLKVAKSGLKMKPAAGPPSDPKTALRSKLEGGRNIYTFRGAPWDRVAGIIDGWALFAAQFGVAESDMVIDETGLSGYYDGDLEFDTPSAAKAADPSLSMGPPLKDAVVDQLGLIMEVRKAPRKILVIKSSDHLPTEN